MIYFYIGKLMRNMWKFQVTYQTDLFLDKNKDYVVAEHQALLYASTCPFVSGLFVPSPEESSNKSKFSSIGSRFKVGDFFSFLFHRNMIWFSSLCTFDIPVHMSCSNNYKPYLKFLVPLSHTTFVVLNPIIFSSLQFLSTKMFCSNCAVE